jgi:long-chain acyl-CoA synthetase
VKSRSNASSTLGIPDGWPVVTLSVARALLTAPGAPFEMEETTVVGRPTRVWKHTPRTLATLAEQARGHGDQLFSVYQDERVSYDAHFRAVAALARWLVDEGVTRGDRVALAMRNLPEWPVVFFAVTTVGAIAVPLNAWWSGTELLHGLADSGSSWLFCDEERGHRVASAGPRPHGLRRMVMCRMNGAAPAGAARLEDIIGRPQDYSILQPCSARAAAIEPDDDAAIFYTSGTTGRPKGATASHRNILTHIHSSGYAAARNILRRGCALGTSPPSRRLLTVPLFHVTGCLSMISGMPAGSTIVLMHKWDPVEAMKIIERERISVTGGVPTIVWQLLDHPARADFDLSSLESIAYGGAPASCDMVRRIRLELKAMPSTGWGMTETLSTVTSLGAEDYLLRPESCGLPVPVADLKIMNLDGVQQVPIGEAGELWARGPMVGHRYWNRPEESAASFVDGWVRTGDIAKLDEAGFCTLVDRAKDVIIRGGENIYCCEVENVIHDHPAVGDVALLGVPHRTLGEQPAALVHLRAGMSVSEAELQSWVRERLAAFKVPVRILFATRPLVRNAGGKLLKTELRALFSESLDATYSAPLRPHRR